MLRRKEEDNSNPPRTARARAEDRLTRSSWYVSKHGHTQRRICCFLTFQVHASAHCRAAASIACVPPELYTSEREAVTPQRSHTVSVRSRARWVVTVLKLFVTGSSLALGGTPLYAPAVCLATSAATHCLNPVSCLPGFHVVCPCRTSTICLLVASGKASLRLTRHLPSPVEPSQPPVTRCDCGAFSLCLFGCSVLDRRTC